MLKYFGVNQAIGFGLMTRIWSVFSGPISMVVIASSLTITEQGYYYAFASLLALQIFFELGLVTVLAQFISHEFVSLSWGHNGEIVGDEIKKNRVLDILGKSLKWYSVCSVFLILTLSFAGYLFFRNETSHDISWKLPWFLSVVGVGMNLLIIPFYGVISGSGDVASVNFRELIGGVLGSLLCWTVLILGGELYAIPAVTFGNIIVGVLYLIRNKSVLIIQGIRFSLMKTNILNSISWRHEVFPMQWKIAISWISGYFIFHLFTPVLFKFHGAEVAGKMGMTLAAITAIQQVCLTWPISKMPEFGKCIAQKKWTELDALFQKTLNQSLEVCLLLVIAFLFVLSMINNFSNLGIRFLPIWEIVIFSISIVGQLLINSFAIYMRAHKKEPMMFLSVVGALLTGLSTFFLGYYFSSLGVIIGFVVITFFYGLPTTYILFKRFKKDNHH
jgi:hypothetical protein